MVVEAADKEISRQLKAKLMGFCHAAHESMLPVLWTEVGKAGTNNEEIRDLFMAAWEESQAALSIDHSECYPFYLEDKTIKDWRTGNFAPGGLLLVYEYLMRGMVPLLFMSW